MPSYVEEAILRVRDQSTKPVRKIDKELKKLLKTARSARNMRLTFSGIKQASADVQRMRDKLRSMDNSRVRINFTGLRQGTMQLRSFRTLLNSLPRSRRIGVTTNVTAATVTNLRNLRSVANSLSNRRNINIPVMAPGLTATLTKLREMSRLVSALNGRSVRVPVSAGAARTTSGGPAGQSVAGMNTAEQFASGFRRALSPMNVGRNIARGFTFGVSGELYNLGRQTVLTGVAAPIRMEDAVSRVRIAGRSEDETALLREMAERASSDYQAVSAADLLANSGEFTGRYGDFNEPANAALVENAMLRFARNAQILMTALPNMTAEGAANQARLVETAIQQTGATGDADFAAEISDTVIRAAIVSGGDLTIADVKRTLQQLSTARVGIGSDSLAQFLLARDTGGRRSTGEFRQAYTDLYRSTLSNKATGLQIEAGLRNEDGSANREVMEAFQSNYLEDYIGGIIMPLLRDRDVDLSSSTEILAALPDLGFVKEGGMTALVDSILNYDEEMAEFARFLAANPQHAIDNPTTRQRGTEVAAQFQNLSTEILEPLLGPVSTGLKTLSNGLNAVANGDAGPSDYLAMASAAAPVGLYAAISALANPETAHLGAAGLALTSSALSLTGAATALTGAAAVQGISSGATGAARGGRFSGIMGLGAVLARVVPAAVGAYAMGAARDSGNGLFELDVVDGAAVLIDARSVASLNEINQLELDKNAAIGEQNSTVMATLAEAVSDKLNVTVTPAQTVELEHLSYLTEELKNMQEMGAVNSPVVANIQDDIVSSSAALTESGFDMSAIEHIDLSSVFDDASSVAGDNLVSSAQEAAPMLVGELAAQANAIGNAIGTSAAAVISQATVNTNGNGGPAPYRAPEPALNVGSSTVF